MLICLALDSPKASPPGAFNITVWLWLSSAGWGFCLSRKKLTAVTAV